MSDEKPEQGASDELAAIERMQQTLGKAIEGVRTESRDIALKAVEEFAEKLEKKRSAAPPVPPKGETKRDAPKGDFFEAQNVRALGDGTAPLYRRMESGRSIEDKEDFRASRNPRMDDLTAKWCKAVASRDVGARVALYDEMNGRYAESLGYSRASLLEGDPNADSGFADGTGAELLPLPLAGQLIVERDKAGKMRSLVNVFPMSAQTQRIPILPTAAASTRAENAAFTDNTPAADTALLAATDLGVMFSAGRNFLEDSAFNMANQLTVVAGGAIGAEEDVQICTSTANGADITEGLDAATIAVVAEATAGSIFFEDIVNLYYAVPEQYRRNAKFFGSSTILATIAGVQDAVSRPIFLNGVDAPRALNDQDPDAVGLLYGKPVYEVPVAAANLYFGDPMWYALGNRTGIRVDVERAVTTGNTQWVIDERIDGRVIPTSVVGTNAAWRQLVI